ncbi:MAG TPA: hypothetical protein DIT89_15620 [Planctomycetaceae bacterium]|nr:hypothetical protein [Planctomycetaceae bacterium]
MFRPETGGGVAVTSLLQRGTGQMQAPQTSAQFFELLEKSGLLSGENIRRAAEKLQLSDDLDARTVAARLAAERILTPFQSERILEGRYRGLLIDGYRVREVLGFGGMGCVFIAEEPGSDRKVALKVLSTEHALDAGMLARMKLEAAAGMRLNHPGIIRTHRLASTGAVHYLVMDLVRGISLHEIVALRGPLKHGIACDVGMQAALALHAAHQSGIIHRDIKPANFLLENDGTVRVLDFGLAMIEDSAEDEFSLSMVFGHDCLGTPDYIAPEQSLDSRRVDPRADVYSLGATLYVAFTARVPFPDKSNKAKLEAQRTRVPKNICELRPEIPAEVGAVILKMMAKDPADRYQTAAEAAEALRPFAVRKPIPFDFRELVTLRAKQAKEKTAAREKGPASPPRTGAPRSSITNASDWLSGVDSRTVGADSFAAPSTPAARTHVSPAAGSPAGARPVPTAGRASDGVVSNSGAGANGVPGDARGLSSSGAGQPALPSLTNLAALPQGWHLQLAGSAVRLPLQKPRCAIGCGTRADICVTGAGVDSLQGWLECRGGQWFYRHDSQRFGTQVNGESAVLRPLQAGDRLMFGENVQLQLLGPAVRGGMLRWVLLLLLVVGLAGAVFIVVQRPDLVQSYLSSGPTSAAPVSLPSPGPPAEGDN